MRDIIGVCILVFMLVAYALIALLTSWFLLSVMHYNPISSIGLLLLAIALPIIFWEELLDLLDAVLPLRPDDYEDDDYEEDEE